MDKWGPNLPPMAVLRTRRAFAEVKGLLDHPRCCPTPQSGQRLESRDPPLTGIGAALLGTTSFSSSNPPYGLPPPFARPPSCPLTRHWASPCLAQPPSRPLTHHQVVRSCVNLFGLGCWLAFENGGECGVAGVAECEEPPSAWRFGTSLPIARSINIMTWWANVFLVPGKYMVRPRSAPGTACHPAAVQSYLNLFGPGHWLAFKTGKRQWLLQGLIRAFLPAFWPAAARADPRDSLQGATGSWGKKVYVGLGVYSSLFVIVTLL